MAEQISEQAPPAAPPSHHTIRNPEDLSTEQKNMCDDLIDKMACSYLSFHFGQNWRTLTRANLWKAVFRDDWNSDKEPGPPPLDRIPHPDLGTIWVGRAANGSPENQEDSVAFKVLDRGVGLRICCVDYQGRDWDWTMINYDEPWSFTRGIAAAAAKFNYMDKVFNEFYCIKLVVYWARQRLFFLNRACQPSLYQWYLAEDYSLIRSPRRYMFNDWDTQTGVAKEGLGLMRTIELWEQLVN